MDADRFDDALRRFSTSRRPLAGLVIGGLFGAGLFNETAAKKKKKCAKKCADGCCTSKHGKCIRPDQQSAAQCGTGGEICRANCVPPPGPPPVPPVPPSPPPPPCQTDNQCPTGLNCNSAGQCVCRTNGRCTGCCASATSCVMLDATSDAACGVNGNACVACKLGAQCTKSVNVCRCDAESSNDGCCNAERDEGFPGITNSHCGKNGEICVACGSNETCVAQECEPNPPQDCTVPCQQSGDCTPYTCFGNLYCCPADITNTCNVPDLICNCIVEGGGCSQP